MFESENRVAIKICGLSRVEDALFCAGAGVEMLGLNFSAESARRVAPDVAREIVSAVRARFSRIQFVGIFVNQERSLVQQITADLALDAVQLHGDETPEYATALRAPFVIKAFRVGTAFAEEKAASFPCDAVLLDSWNAHTRGGTGETFSWPTAAALRPRVKRLILAGGLTSRNVAEAIELVRPDAVDVCSGVEDAPGRKSADKVQRFVAAVCETAQ